MRKTELALIGFAMIASPVVMADDFVGFGDRTAVSLQSQGATWVEMSDLDQDGDIDAVQGSLTGITTLLNDGSGGFGSEQFYASQSFSDRRFIVGDLNGDGFPDLIGVDGTGNGLELWLNLADGSMGPRITIPGGWSGGAAGHIFAADFNNDGDLDIVVEHGDATGIHRFTNDGTAGFTADPVIAFPLGQDLLRLTAGDVDGDGLADIVVIGRPGNNNNDYRITTYRNDGAGGFIPDIVSSGFATLFSEDLRLVDVDLDSDLDLVVSNGPNLAIVTNNGLGSFSGRINYSTQAPAPQSLHQIAVADINGDAYPDLAIGDNQNTNRVFVYCNDGTGGFATPTIYSSEGTGSVSSQAVALADVDGNSTPDLLTGSDTNSGVSYFNHRLNQMDVVEPGAFSLFGPADAATDLSLPENITGWGINAPRFSWGQPTGFQTSYDLSVMTANFPMVEVFSASGIQSRSFEVPSGVLESGTQYLWLVTAVNSVGETPALAAFTFTTADGPRSCEPDLNGDGRLDFFDVSLFINAYTAGCP